MEGSALEGRKYRVHGGSAPAAARDASFDKDGFPSTRKIGLLHDPTFPVQQEIALASEAARRLGIEIEPAEAASRAEYLEAVERLRAPGA